MIETTDADLITVSRSQVNHFLNNAVASVYGRAQLLADGGECQKDREAAAHIVKLIEENWMPQMKRLFGPTV